MYIRPPWSSSVRIAKDHLQSFHDVDRRIRDRSKLEPRQSQRSRGRGHSLCTGQALEAERRVDRLDPWISSNMVRIRCCVATSLMKRYAWRHVMEPLADLGYDVIVPDYRGAGASSRPVTGYDKITMATDIHTLYHDVLGIGQAVIVGHDVGSMVALALAIKFGQDLLALVICGVPDPSISGVRERTN